VSSPLIQQESIGESESNGDYQVKREIIVNGEGAEEEADEHVDEAASGKTLTYEQLKAIFTAIRVPAISVWFIFTVSIGCFPALIVLLKSSNQCKNNDRFSNDLFVPFFFVMFNLFDLFGRLTAGSTTLIFTTKNIWMASLSRVVFFPLFLLCNIADSKLPVWFENDAFPIIFMIIFAYSNGYIASACMMLGPSAVSVKDAAVAGTIMVFSLTLGLFSGACMSFVVAYISQGSLV
jgi:equilibrative nucleoside transporter 1/2/3